MGYWIGVAGTWLMADGLFSLLVHTKPPLSDHQTFLRDHSFRLVRCMIGLALIALGVASAQEGLK